MFMQLLCFMAHGSSYSVTVAGRGAAWGTCATVALSVMGTAAGHWGSFDLVTQTGTLSLHAHMYSFAGDAALSIPRTHKCSQGTELWDVPCHTKRYTQDRKLWPPV